MGYPSRGDRLSGRYEIEELLGQGGMGRVYAARDLEGGGRVAVKVLAASMAGNEGGVQRFEREIATLRKLDHPDILGYVDHGRDGDTVYMVTELLEGATLAETAAEFRGHADRVLFFGARLAGAFAAAHARGVIHRDIKPSNVFLARDGRPRILDYGLARWFAPEGADPAALTTLDTLTGSGIVGTVPYMSPEQIGHEPLDVRTDVFSLGVLLYELACGTRPFRGATLTELFQAMRDRAQEPLWAHEPRLDGPEGRALDAILAPAIAAEREGRYPTMGAFAQALAAARDSVTSLPAGASVAILLPPAVSSRGRRHVILRGRERDLAWLGGRLPAPASGARTVFVEGPAGIGKSSILGELLQRAHAGGIVALVSDGAGHDPLAQWRRKALELFPGEGNRAGGSEAQALSDLIRALTARAPMVLVLENAQRAEPPALAGLREAIGSTSGASVTWILEARDDEPLDDERAVALEELRAATGSELLAVGPLAATDLGALAEEAYPGLDVDAGLREAWVELCGGNPRYCRSLLDALRERGDLARDGADWVLRQGTSLPIPPAADEDLDDRLERLAPTGLAMLECAAVAGDAFEVADVAAMAGCSTQETAAALVAAASASRLIVHAEREYRWRVPPLRAALRERLPQERRRALHTAAARTLEARLGNASSLEVGPDLHAALAAHLVEAGEPSRAIPHAVAAGLGSRAFGRAAPAEVWLRRAISLIERQLEAAEVEARKPLRATLAEVEVALAGHLDEHASHEAALRGFEKARGLSLEIGRSDLQVASLVGLSRAFLARGDLLQAERRAREASKVARHAGLEIEWATALSAEAHALSRAGEHEPAEERWAESAKILETAERPDAVEVYLMLGNHHLRLDRTDQAEACYVRAAALAGSASPTTIRARIEDALGAVALARGEADRARPHFECSAQLWRSVGDRSHEARSLHNIGYCHGLLGQLEEARRVYEEVLEARTRIGEAGARSSTQCNYGQVLLQLGRLEGAHRHATEALAVKREIEDRSYLPSCLTLVGEVELELGRCERARNAFAELLREYAANTHEAVKAAFGTAQAAFLAGDDAEAEDRFREAFAACGGGLGFVVRYSVAARCLAFLAETERPAADLREGALRLAGTEEPGPNPRARMLAATCSGLAAQLSGGRAEARMNLERALEDANSLGAVEIVCRLRVQLARLEQDVTLRARRIREAADNIRRQADAIVDPELRACYLARRDRAVILVEDSRDRG